LNNFGSNIYVKENQLGTKGTRVINHYNCLHRVYSPVDSSPETLNRNMRGRWVEDGVIRECQ
jgi:hypothetical protein